VGDLAAVGACASWALLLTLLVRRRG
jgi:hypothetical protein